MIKFFTSLIEKITHLLKKEYSYPKLILFFILTGIIINLPYTVGRFSSDDFMFVSILEENIPYNTLTGFWSLNFEDFPGFQSMWWVDAEADGKFFRPLPSLVFAVTFEVFGRSSAIPLHIISIIMHSMAAFSVFLLFVRLSKRYAISLLAAFLFLISEDHTMTIGWIATNTDIFAVLFINLSLFFYITFREESDYKKLLTSILLLFLAFLCKETAIITPVAIVLYEFIFQTKPKRGRNLIYNLGHRFLALIKNWKYWGVIFLFLIIYLIFYKSASYGAFNLMYYDPFGQPIAYIKNLFVGYPLLFAGYLSVLPIGLTPFIKGISLPFALAGILLFIIFLVTLYPYRKNKVIQFCFILFIVSILPQLSTIAAERLLYFPFVAGCFIVSFLIFQIKIFKKEFSPKTPKRVKYLGSIMGYYFIVSSLILSLILSIIYPYSYKSSLEYPEEVILECKSYTDETNTDHIILLNTPGPFIALYAKDIFRYHYNGYKDVQVLSSFNGIVMINKLSDNSIVLRTEDEGWLTNFFALVIRAEPKIEEGYIYQSNDFFASVTKTTPDKKDVLQVKFDFKYSLNSDNVVLLYYDGEKMNKWDFKNQIIGKWMLVGDSSDIMKGF